MLPYALLLLSAPGQAEVGGLADWKWTIVGVITLGGLLAALLLAIAESWQARRARRSQAEVSVIPIPFARGQRCRSARHRS